MSSQVLTKDTGNNEFLLEKVNDRDSFVNLAQGWIWEADIILEACDSTQGKGRRANGKRFAKRDIVAVS